MKILLLAALLYFFPSVSNDANRVVYVSKGCKAYAYHVKKSCRTLKKCNAEGHVVVVALSKAKEMGRRPCKVCCKQDGAKACFAH